MKQACTAISRTRTTRTERKEELGSLSYVNPDKARDTQLVYALDFLRGVNSAASDAAKKSAEVR